MQSVLFFTALLLSLFGMQQINANKPHIAIYGRCNSGKSSLLNRLAAEELSIVSNTPGTTTDPVKRSFEIEGFGPVLFFDTAGIDDTSSLGALRVKKSFETIEWIDFAIVLFAHNEFGEPEEGITKELTAKGVSYIIVHNNFPNARFNGSVANVYEFIPDDANSANIILQAVKNSLPEWSYTQPSLFDGTINENDFVLLVTPIDVSAPAGRLILPQVQAIRNLLDRRAISAVVQPSQIAAIQKLPLTPKLIVADSQVLKEVTELIHDSSIPITTFSILLAQSKGNPKIYKDGLEAADRLEENDKILIIENCAHQTSCDDIGRVKIPGWLERYCAKKFQFTVVNALNPLPEPLGEYALAVQCGGCMVTRRQLHNRINRLLAAGVPVTNYGMLIKKIR